MKIGIFDSGLGGLIITHSIITQLPEYDYVFLGDTARVPYGNRSSEAVYEFTRQGVDYLLSKDCGLVIIACNTASAEALRKLQHDYLPNYFPDRHLLGVLVPAVEAAVAATTSGRIGVLATHGTVASGAFERELLRRRPKSEVTQVAAPLLVPLVEHDGLRWAPMILEEYLQPLWRADIDTLILGCTHYPILRETIQKVMGEKITIIGQDQVVPLTLTSYLERQTDLAKALAQNRSHQFLLTDLTADSQILARRLFGSDLGFTKVAIDTTS